MATYTGGDGDDTYTGTDGFDSISGGGGADRIFGEGGNDSLASTRKFEPNSLMFESDTDADLVDGGGGNDHIYAAFGDTVDGGGGQDVLSIDLRNSASGVVADFTNKGQYAIGDGSIDSMEFLEFVIGSQFGDDLTLEIYTAEARRRGATAFAQGGDDGIMGSDAGDYIKGEAGNDSIQGHHGHDRLVGGDGDDTILGGTGIDALGYAHRDRVDEAGDDLLDGGAHDDRIHGGAGNDILIGGGGSDQLNGGDGVDTASYAGSERVAVSLALDTAQDTLGSGTDTLIDIENLIGSDGDDRLEGNSRDNRLAGGSGDDVLIGDEGDDTLVGGLGADTMRGGAGNDFYIVSNRDDIVVEDVSAGLDEVMATITYRLGENVENLRLAGSAVRGIGNANDNELRGNGADNRMNGLAGQDLLLGGAGEDWLRGGAGDDVLEGGAGRDTLIGSIGADWFRFDNGHSAAALGESDVITGFSGPAGDRIDLGEMDADVRTREDDGFTFIGESGFSGEAGQLREKAVNGITYIQGDTDGDRVADFTIRIDGTPAITSNDFIL